MLHIGFLIFPGFPMACLTSVIEPLRAANEISGQGAFSWTLLSEPGGKVTASADVAFDSACLADQMRSFDYLLLLGAPGSNFSDTRSAGTLRRLSRHGTVLGAISGGVFALVRSGAVPDTRLSVHWCYDAAFRAEFPQVAASDQVIEITPRCVTASGAAAAFDLALHLVASTLGETVATEVACWFQHPMMRKSGVRQAMPAPTTGYTQAGAEASGILARASALFLRDLSEPMSVGAVAEALDISPRHLERSFKKASGQNPSQYFRALRMKAARQIVMYSNDRISDVAAAVGYPNPKVFARNYKQCYGLSPQEDRKRINLYRVEGNLPVPST